MKAKIIKLAQDIAFARYCTLQKEIQTKAIKQECSDLLTTDSVLGKMVELTPALPSPSFNISVTRPPWLKDDALYRAHLQVEAETLKIQAESMRCAWLHCIQRLVAVESAIANCTNIERRPKSK